MRKKHLLWTLAFALLLTGGCAWQQGLGEDDRIFTYANTSNLDKQVQPTKEAGMLTIEEAKAKALVDAGLVGVQVTFTKSELDYDNGRQVYEIEFYTQDYEYEYEIDASTGEIIDFACEKREGIHTGNITNTPVNNKTEQPVNAGAATVTPAASDSSKTAEITMEQAKAMVLKWIPGATEKDIWKAKTEYDNGRTEYEIKVLFGNAEYEFEIDASAGKVIECQYDAAYTTAPAAGGSTITIEKAKSLALEKVPGATENDILKFKTDYDDGRTEYEIEIVFGNAEYDFEIDAYTGKIMSLDYNAKYIILPSVTPGASAGSTTITAEQAKELALARVPGATAQDILEFETDYDDGRAEYEGKILYGGVEYEFGLDCCGTFHCWKTETVGYGYYDCYSGHHSGQHGMGCRTITAASAKSLALAQVPGATARNIVEFETDYDDGRIEYEGKIVYKGMEYEFEIDGYSGAFRKWESEPAD